MDSYVASNAVDSRALTHAAAAPRVAPIAKLRAWDGSAQLTSMFGNDPKSRLLEGGRHRT